MGLVGRIKKVTPNYSVVQLLTDPTHRVAARVINSKEREMGIVRYLPSEGLVLDNLPNQCVASVGDIVLSSGLGMVFPENLKVGTIKEIERPENKPFARAMLQPSVNFHSIEELFVIMPEDQ